MGFREKRITGKYIGQNRGGFINGSSYVLKSRLVTDKDNVSYIELTTEYDNKCKYQSLEKMLENWIFIYS